MNQQATSYLRVIPCEKTKLKKITPSKVRFFASSFFLKTGPNQFLAVFFQMEGLRTAAVALNDQGVPFRQFRHPTWLYSDKKYFPPKFGPKKGPFWAKTVPEEGRYKAKVCGNHEFNPGVAAGGSWD